MADMRAARLEIVGTRQAPPGFRWEIGTYAWHAYLAECAGVEPGLKPILSPSTFMGIEVVRALRIGGWELIAPPGHIPPPIEAETAGDCA